MLCIKASPALFPQLSSHLFLLPLKYFHFYFLFLPLIAPSSISIVVIYSPVFSLDEEVWMKSLLDLVADLEHFSIVHAASSGEMTVLRLPQCLFCMFSSNISSVFKKEQVVCMCMSAVICLVDNRFLRQLLKEGSHFWMRQVHEPVL